MIIKDSFLFKQTKPKFHPISSKFLQLSLFLSLRDGKVGHIPTTPLDLHLAIIEDGDDLKRSLLN